MPISTKCLVDKINTALTCDDLSSVQLTSLAESARTLIKNVVKVAKEADLPLASDNIGRFIYVESLQDYLYSNGAEWTRQYDTTRVYYNTIWTWGSNSVGQLGSNNIISRSSPGSIVGEYNDWCAIGGSGSTALSMGIRSDGTLWGWGANQYGILDGGTISVSRSSPVLVVGGISDWKQIEIGSGFVGGLRSDGTIWTWGRNSGGILGDNTVVNRSSPVSVVGGFTDWCQVKAGIQHMVGLRSVGEIWAWGCATSGPIGDNTVVNRSSPVSIVGGFTDWCQVTAKGLSTAAVRTDGTIWAWGSNGQGRLGDGTTVAKSSPVSIVGGFTNWSSVAAGYSHMLAIKTDGSLWAWGCNGQGRLGNGASLNQSSPVSVTCGFTDWCQVSAHYHSVGLRTNGTLWAWGCNAQGRLGDGTAIDRTVGPVSVVGNYNDWACVHAAQISTMALRFICTKGF